MKHLSIIAIIILATIANAFAQEKEESSKWEIYGGYSTVKPNFSGQNIGQKTERRGYEVSLTRNLDQYFGLKFDYSGNFISERVLFSTGGTPTEVDVKSSAHIYTGGIQVKDNAAKSRIKPFGHVLFGTTIESVKGTLTISNTSMENTNTQSDLLMIFGGGLDVKLNDRISLRPFQFDYLRTRHFNQNITNYTDYYRFGADIVFH